MPDERYLLRADELDALFAALRGNGYQTVGPTRRDDTIVYDLIDSADELPVGWVDDQEAGRYSIRNTGSGRTFDHTVGPQGWRKFLRPPREPLWSSRRRDDDVTFEVAPTPTPQYALIGVRSCDLAALGVLDRVLTQQAHRDTRYASRRDRAFIVAVQCARAGNTCFCVSMDTGPRSDNGFDLALTELPDLPARFLVEVGSDRGQTIADALGLPPTDVVQWEQALEVTNATAASMGRTLDTDGIRDALMDNLEHPNWDNVAQRCLSCANCTNVCPTCFCTTTEIDTDLRNVEATQTQVWDSCFHADFSYMHGGAVRQSTRSRYRQWLTHKLATWHDQFGQSGCVGCGRCITWCPVGIDLTAEVAKIRTEKTL